MTDDHSTVAIERAHDGTARPLRHAYPINDELVVWPGMVARCGHVRTEAEGRAAGDITGVPLDPCMVCVELDRGSR